MHWELTEHAGSHLTLARARALLAGSADLREGDKGADVARWQRLLGVPADGVFGPRTTAAVNKVKREHGWAQDGVLGARVRKALRERAS